MITKDIEIFKENEGGLYLGIAEKILSVGNDFVETELKRIIRLNESNAIESKTKTKFIEKINVLKEFQNELKNMDGKDEL